MFDLFSWSHILILLTAALVFVGPQELPRLMHMAGRWAGKARNMANEFRKSFDEMARQSELDELRKEVEALRSNAQVADLQNTMNQPVSAPTPPAPEPVPEPVPPRSGELQVTGTPSPTPDGAVKP